MNIIPDPFGMLAQILILSAIGIALTIFWLWALIDAIKNEPSGGNDKVIWVLVIALLHSLGALIYVFIRRPSRIAALGK